MLQAQTHKLTDRKCTGERPCKSCQKAGQDCRYEEIQRRKPKAVMLDERLGECFLPNLEYDS